MVDAHFRALQLKSFANFLPSSASQSNGHDDAARLAGIAFELD
jgi:hypothetical protein